MLKKHESDRIINNSIVEKNRHLDIINNQLVIEVEFAQIKYTNEKSLDKFINRDNYQRNYDYRDVVYWYDIKNQKTDDCPIPFRCTEHTTFYISLDNEFVTYIR